jgi:hypothetical protein
VVCSILSRHANHFSSSGHKMQPAGGHKGTRKFAGHIHNDNPTYDADAHDFREAVWVVAAVDLDRSLPSDFRG